jgi:hypothetical protein
MPAAGVAMRRVHEGLRLFSGMSKHENARCTRLAASTVRDTIARFRPAFDAVINRAGR